MNTVSVIEHALNNEDIECIVNESLKFNNYNRFSISIPLNIKQKIEQAFNLNLVNIQEIPMTWICGDSSPHIDIGTNEFFNTYLIYLTNNSGHLVIENELYPIKKGCGISFASGLSHKTINTDNSPRLMIGPFSEQGFRVGEGLLSQTITFEPLANTSILEGTITLTATADSNLVVTYESSDSNIASVDGSILSLLKVGEVIITASQDGNELYDAAANVSQSLDIIYGTQTITFEPLANTSILEGTITLTATSDSNLAVTYESSDSTIASVDGSTLSLLKVGEVIITASQDGNNIYAAASNVSQTLDITYGTQTITFEPLANTSILEGTITLTATSDSNLTVSYASSDSTIASVDGSTLFLLKVGEVIITASQDGNDVYEAAANVSETLYITYGTQTITFEPLANTSILEGTITLAATADSNLTVSYASSDSTIASVDGSILSLLKIGEVIITASQDGNDVYEAAANVSETLYITYASQIITFEPLANTSILEGSITLTATADSNLTVTYESSDSTIASVNGSILSLLKVGEVIITASQDGNDVYEAAANVSETLYITYAPQIITFEPLANTSILEGSIILTATADSNLTVAYESSDSTIASVDGSILSLLKVGEVIITASQDGNDVYEAAANVSQTLDITYASQTITFEPISDQCISVGSITLSASSDSGLSITYISSNSTIASISESTVNLLKSGNITITAYQSGNIIYAPTSFSQSFNINLIIPSLYFTLPVKTYGDEPFIISQVTSNSAGSVTFTSGNTYVATIEGNVITIQNAGMSTITVNQIEYENYASGNSNTNFVVYEATPSISFSLSDVSFGDSYITPNPISDSDSLFSYTSSNTYVATINDNLIVVGNVGITTITAYQPANQNYLSNSANASLNVLGIKPILSSFSLPLKFYGNSPFTITPPQSNSNGSFSYLSSNIRVANISGNTVSILSSGTSNITALQEASGNYTNSSISSTFTVLDNSITSYSNAYPFVYSLIENCFVTSTVSKFDNCSLYIDQNSSLSISNISGNVSNWTTEFWINISNSAGNGTILKNNLSNSLELNYNSINSSLILSLGNTKAWTTANAITCSNVITTGIWNHLALVYSSSNGYGFFINGQNQISISDPLLSPANYTLQTHAGITFSSTVYYADGGSLTGINTTVITGKGTAINTSLPWTFECYFNLSTISGQQLVIEDDFGLQFCIVSNNGIGKVQIVLGNGSDWFYISSYNGITISVNTWYHGAVVYNNGVYSVYINGVLDTTLTLTSSTKVSSNLFKNFRIGRNYNGYMSHLKLSSRAVYTTNFTPPSSLRSDEYSSFFLSLVSKNSLLGTSSLSSVDISNVIIGGNDLVCNIDELLISSENKYGSSFLTKSFAFPARGANTIVLNHFEVISSNIFASEETFQSSYVIYRTDNCQITNTYAKFGSNSLYILGTGGFIVGGISLTTWQLEFFLLLPSVSNAKIIDFSSIGANQDLSISSGYLSMYCVPYTIRTSYTLTTNTWYHVVMTRQNNTYGFYVNGSSIGTITTTRDPDYYFLFNSGYFDELRILNTLTTVSVPTSPYSVTNSTIALNHFESSDVELSDDVYLKLMNMTTSSSDSFIQSYRTYNAEITSRDSKYGTSSLFINNDMPLSFLRVNLGSKINYFRGDFTIEFWFKLLNDNQMISAVPSSLSSSTDSGYCLVSSTDEYYKFAVLINRTTKKLNLYKIDNRTSNHFWNLGNGGNFEYGTSIVTLNTWNHIAISYTIATKYCSIYLNGILDVNTQIGSSFSINTFSNLTIGRRFCYPKRIDLSAENMYNFIGISNNNFYGYIDELMISAYAKYTTAFTPSSLTQNYYTMCFNHFENNNLILSEDTDYVTIRPTPVFNYILSCSGMGVVYNSGIKTYNLGSSSTLSITNLPSTYITPSWTLEFWFKGTFTSFGSLVSASDISGYSSSQWNYVVMSYDGSTNTSRLYLNDTFKSVKNQTLYFDNFYSLSIKTNYLMGFMISCVPIYTANVSISVPSTYLSPTANTIILLKCNQPLGMLLSADDISYNYLAYDPNIYTVQNSANCLIQYSISGNVSTSSNTSITSLNNSLLVDNTLNTSFLRILQNEFYLRGDWTLEFWFNISSINTNNKIINIYPFYCYLSSNLLTFNSVNTRVASTVIQKNTWYHLALTQQNYILKLYVNGCLETICDTNSTLNFKQIGYFTLFRNITSYVNLLRLSSIVRYSSNFTPSTNLTIDSNTLALNNLDTSSNLIVSEQSLDINLTYNTPTNNYNYSTDSLTGYLIGYQGGIFGNSALNISNITPSDPLLSPAKYTLSLNQNITFSTTVYYADGGSLQGINNILITGSGPTLNTNSSWTFECYFYLTSFSGQQLVIENSFGFQFTVVSYNGAGRIQLVLGDGTSWFNISNPGDIVINQNVWYHGAVVFNNGIYKVYVNGVLDTGLTFSSSKKVGNFLNNFSIGRNYNGYMSHIKVSSITVYTSNFTSPTTLRADNNTVFFLSLVSKNSVLGISAYPPGGNIIISNLGTNDLCNLWTLEYWIKGNISVITPELTLPSIVSNSSWNHISYVQDSTELRMYLNGLQQTYSGNLLITSGTMLNNLKFKNNATGGNVYMNGLRISNSVRYSGNTYTVPSNYFSLDSNTIVLNNFDIEYPVSYLEITDSMLNANLNVSYSSNSNAFNYLYMLAGDPQINNDISVFGEGSLYLDGNSAIMVTGLSPSNYWSIETWFYLTDTSYTQTILSSFQDNYTFAISYDSTTGKLLPYLGNSSSWSINNLLTGNTTILSNTWYHVLLTQSTNSYILYVNGNVDLNVQSNQALLGYPIKGIVLGATTCLEDILDDQISDTTTGYFNEFIVSNVDTVSSFTLNDSLILGRNNNILVLNHLNNSNIINSEESEIVQIIGGPNVTVISKDYLNSYFYFNDQPPATFILSNPLISGLSLTYSSNVANISGTTNLSGNINTTIYNNTITANSRFGNTSLAFNVLLNPALPNLVVTTGNLDGVYDTLFAYQPNNIGGQALFSISPNLPGNLTINSANGIISGKPRISLANTFTIIATNATGNSQANVTIVVPPIAPDISTNYTLTPALGVPYLYNFNNLGTQSSFTVSPSLTANLTLDNSGFIYGTPSNILAPTTYTFIATNDLGQSSVNVTISVTLQNPIYDCTASAKNLTLTSSNSYFGRPVLCGKFSDTLSIANIYSYTKTFTSNVHTSWTYESWSYNLKYIPKMPKYWTNSTVTKNNCNSWVYAATCYDSSSGLIREYINGNLLACYSFGEYYSLFTASDYTNLSFSMHSSSDTYGYCFLDSIKISIGAISTSNSSISVPTSIFTPDLNTYFLLDFLGPQNAIVSNFTFYDPRVNYLCYDTSFSNIIYTAVGKVYYDNSTAYNNLTSSLYIERGSCLRLMETELYIEDTFTIEFWFKPSSNTGILLNFSVAQINLTNGVVGIQNINFFPPINGQVVDNTASNKDIFNIDTYNVGNTIVQTNVWQHFCLIFSNSILYSYVNGNLVFTSIDRFYYSPTSLRYFVIGYGISLNINNLRISNNVRYTQQNFTPSTTFTKDSYTLGLNSFNGSPGEVNIITTEDQTINTITTGTTVTYPYQYSFYNSSNTKQNSYNTDKSSFEIGQKLILSTPQNYIGKIYGSWTIEFFFYGTTIQFWNSNETNKLFILFSVSGSQLACKSYINSDDSFYGGTQKYVTASQTWNHVAIVYTRNDDDKEYIFTIYANGVRFVYYLAKMSPTILNYLTFDGTNCMNNLKISNVAKYSGSTYTVPTSLSSDQYTIFFNNLTTSLPLALLDLGQSFTSSNCYTYTNSTQYTYTLGNVSTSNSIYKFNTGSTYFDGNSCILIDTSYYTLPIVTTGYGLYKTWSYGGNYRDYKLSVYGTYNNYFMLGYNFIDSTAQWIAGSVWCVIYNFLVLPNDSNVCVNFISRTTNSRFYINSTAYTMTNNLNSSYTYLGNVTLNAGIHVISYFSITDIICFSMIDNSTNKVLLHSDPSWFQIYGMGPSVGSFAGQPSRLLPNLTYTSEFWFYPNSIISDQTLVSSYYQYNPIQILISSGKLKFCSYVGNTSGTSTITDNTWNHIAFTQSNCTTSVYLNGTLEITQICPLMPEQLSPLLIGSQLSDTIQVTKGFTGYINELFLSNSVIYSSNFTPQTQSYGGIFSNTTLTLNHLNLSNLTICEESNITTFSVQDLYFIDKSYQSTKFTYNGPNPTPSILGNLPFGLTFDSANIIVSGTPNINAGLSGQVYPNNKLASISNFGNIVSTNFTIYVNPQAPSIYGNSSVVGTYLQPFNYRVSSNGGPIANYAFSGNSLPTNLVFNSSNGSITGIPNVALQTQRYSITANNITGTSTQTFTLTIPPIIPSLSALSLNVIGGVDIPFSYVITNSGTPSTFTISPSLPSGLSIDPESGTISGTPNVNSIITKYTITAVNNAGSSNLSANITILIRPNISGPSTYTSVIGTPTNYNIVNTGDPAIFSIDPLSLPPGLVFNTSSGNITGIPIINPNASTYVTNNYTITANNYDGISFIQLSLKVDPADPIYPATANITGIYLQPFNYQPTNTGGPISFNSITLIDQISLPSGLVFNSSNGSITGIPRVALQSTRYKITANNVTGNTSVILTLKIPAVLPQLIGSNSNIIGGIGVPLVYTVINNGSPSSFSIDPSLPTGLRINTSNGTISGIPSVRSLSTNYIVTAMNDAGNSSSNVNITVMSRPNLSGTSNLIMGYIASPFYYAVNNSGDVISYSISPNLPTSLQFNKNTGVITGVPTSILDTTSFIITGVSPAGSSNVTANISFCPLYYALQTAFSDVTYNAAPNTLLNYIFSYSSTNLPNNMSLNNSTGVITGLSNTESNVATYTININTISAKIMYLPTGNIVCSEESQLNNSNTLVFNGIDQCLTINNLYLNSITEQFSLELSVNATSSSNSTILTSDGNLSIKQLNNSLVFSISDIQANTTILTNTWYNIGIVFTGSQYLFYLNGNLENSVINNNINISRISTITLGTSASYDYFKGYLSKFRVSNTSSYSMTTNLFTANNSTIYYNNFNGSGNSFVSTQYVQELGYKYNIPFMVEVLTVYSNIAPIISGPISIKYYTKVSNTYVLTTNNSPALFTISPGLPSGLQLDKFTGNISGRPSVKMNSKKYTISAINTAGNTRITAIIAVYQNYTYFTGTSTSEFTSLAKSLSNSDVVVRTYKGKTSYLTLLDGVASSNISTTVGLQTMALANSNPSYRYLIGMEDSTSFTNTNYYYSKFTMKVFDSSNSSVTTFTDDPLQLEIDTGDDNGSELSVMRLNTTNNSYEDIGVTAAYSGNAYTFTLSNNSDYLLTSLTTSNNSVMGGDPHVEPLHGSRYTMPNIDKVVRIFDNLDKDEHIIINSKMWFLPKKYYSKESKFHQLYLKSYTFMKYVSIIYKTKDYQESIIIDMENLQFCKFTNEKDVISSKLPYLDKVDTKYINVSDIEVSTSVETPPFLYSITYQNDLDSENGIKRDVEVNSQKFGLIKVEVVHDPDDVLDRNHLKIKTEKNMSPLNSFGSLIQEEDFLIVDTLLDTTKIPNRDL